MVLYEYRCVRCAARREVFRKMGDAARPERCSCGAPMRRVYHPTRAIFMVPGFYATDYGRQSDVPIDEPIVVDDSDPAVDRVVEGKKILRRKGML